MECFTKAPHDDRNVSVLQHPAQKPPNLDSGVDFKFKLSLNLTSLNFFHPDYTVGFGITPNQPFGSWAITTGGEFHPALKLKFFLQFDYNPLLLTIQGKNR